MKKTILFSFLLLTIVLTGCNKKKELECQLNDETTVIVVKDNKIYSIKVNDDEEKVTDEEWKTLKNFYEFTDDITDDQIINKLKELNESIGYTCTAK